MHLPKPRLLCTLKNSQHSYHKQITKEDQGSQKREEENVSTTGITKADSKANDKQFVSQVFYQHQNHNNQNHNSNNQ